MESTKNAQSSSNGKTRRWPMVIFCSILNLAGTNVFVLYQNNSDAKLRILLSWPRNSVVQGLENSVHNDRLPLELSVTIKKVLVKFYRLLSISTTFTPTFIGRIKKNPSGNHEMNQFVGNVPHYFKTNSFPNEPYNLCVYICSFLI